MAGLVIKKRGRPSKADIAARNAVIKVTQRSDNEVLTDLMERFSFLATLTKGATNRDYAGNVRAITCTGGPGVGKTYTVEEVLSRSGCKYEVVRGAVSAVNLYKLGYTYREPGNVLVLDDADSIFNDEDALNILKVMCDSSDHRVVSWRKESAALKEDDIPPFYEFRGSIIFISNLDFQRYVDEGKNKFAQHFEALMSRSLYLDLRLHSRNEIGVWVEHVAREGKMFMKQNVSSHVGEEILTFLRHRRDNLRELSLRTLLKTIQIRKTNPNNWERMADILLCKSN